MWRGRWRYGDRDGVEREGLPGIWRGGGEEDEIWVERERLSLIWRGGGEMEREWD